MSARIKEKTEEAGERDIVTYVGKDARLSNVIDTLLDVLFDESAEASFLKKED